MTVKAITSQFNYQGISPKEGLSCTGLDKPRLHEFPTNLVNLKQFYPKNSRKLKKGEKQKICLNVDILVALVPLGMVTRSLK